MGLINVAFLLIFILQCFGQNTNAVNVKTSFGEIEGFQHLMKNGKHANIFLGIPYASSPINELRLEKPQPPKAWNTTLEAKKFASRCTPHNAEIVQWFGPHSEDCLFLNIIAPEITDSESYPVAVWIHGGGFCFGDTEIYGYKQLAENFISRGIIVVTIQYRLGPFGFFSLGDQNVPGNLGLWDQRQALLFLREVLPSFGGNKDQITVWGHSAGGTSTSLLSASPHTRDLFSQSFQMSGSAFVEWGNSKRVIGVSRQLAEHLGCPKTSCSKTIKDCIKTKTTQEILEASDKFGLSRNDLNFDWYHPVADVEWFGKDYVHELQDSPKKPTMIGVTSAESLLCSAYVPDSLATMFSIHMGIKKDDQPKYSKQRFIDFIKNQIATFSAFGNDAEAAFKDLKEFYVDRGTAEEKKQDRFYFNRYTDLLSDIQFTIPSIRDGLEKSKLDWPTYIYLFDYTNPELVEEFGFYGGANHGLELAYLHGAFIFKYFNWTTTDENLRQAYVEGVANFFKHGKPSSQSQEWPQMSTDESFKYFHLGETSQIADKFFSERLKFWETFTDKYHFDLIRGEYRDSKKVKDEL